MIINTSSHHYTRFTWQIYFSPKTYACSSISILPIETRGRQFGCMLYTYTVSYPTDFMQIFRLFLKSEISKNMQYSADLQNFTNLELKNVPSKLEHDPSCPLLHGQISYSEKKITNPISVERKVMQNAKPTSSVNLLQACV